MRKATIKYADVCDRLAQTHEDKEQRGTIIEIIVQTRGKVGEQVNLHELGAVRCVLLSRWINSVKVVHVTAAEWLYLRGLKKATPSQLIAASGRGYEEPTAHPASRAKT
jgi:hypothetical protein